MDRRSFLAGTAQVAGVAAAGLVASVCDHRPVTAKPIPSNIPRWISFFIECRSSCN